MKYLFALLIVLGFAASAQAQVAVYRYPVPTYRAYSYPRYYGYPRYDYGYPNGVYYYRRLPTYGPGPIFLAPGQMYSIPTFGW